MRQRGKAEPGDKTMLDALLPALEACRRDGLADRGAGRGRRRIRHAGDDPMQARKGRASYLGARSVGHPDPGATGSYLLIKTAAETCGGMIRPVSVWHTRLHR